MTDDFTGPDYSAPSTASQTVDGIKAASHRVGDAIEMGLEPGMPLHVLATRAAKRHWQRLR